MGFHDRLALIARRDGDTSAAFRAAAQKNANATWVYLIVAGVVWYFTAWYWALIPEALAVFVAAQSISATATAVRLEKFENRPPA